MYFYIIIYNQFVNIASVSQIIQHLYHEIDGTRISSANQKKLSYYYVGMEYDEVKTDSFCHILDKINPTGGKIFYDLGSGLGKKAISASLYGNFAKSVGIENMDDLYSISQTVLNRYYEIKIPNNSNIWFHQKDFNKYNFSDGDVIFLSLALAAMEIELKGELLHKLNQLKKGADVITTGIPFVSPYFSLMGWDSCDFLAGKGKVFFHRKIL